MFPGFDNMQEIESYIQTFSGAHQAIIFHLRHWMGVSHPNVKETWKYKTLFFELNGPFMYLGLDKKRDQLYLGVVDGIHLPLLEDLFEGKELKQVRRWYVPIWNEEIEEKTLSIIQTALEYREGKQKGFRPFAKR